MNFDTVFKKFTAMAELDGEQANRWKYLVYESIADIKDIIIPDYDSRRYRHRVTTAAAALAFYRYRKLICANGELTGIKAGDLTVNDNKASLDQAYSIYCDALMAIGDLIMTDEMIFGRTESFVQRRNYRCD